MGFSIAILTWKYLDFEDWCKHVLLELPQQFGIPKQVGWQVKHLHRVWLLGKFASLIGCLHMLVVFRKCKFHMHAMMQTRMQKVEKFFVFFITKLGLLQNQHMIEEKSNQHMIDSKTHQHMKCDINRNRIKTTHNW